MNLHQLGWSDSLQRSFDALGDATLTPGRVAREDKGGYVIYGHDRAWRGTLSGAFRHAALTPDDLPAVGDWLALRPRTGADAAVIQALLPRTSCVRRTAAGGGTRAQVIAANVDYLVICTGLDRDFNPRRVERYLTLAYAAGTSPLVLLTKADACDCVEACVARMQAAAPGAPVIAISAVTGDGCAALRASLPAGVTAALVGSSGVGKSTLINALLGEERMATRAVRAHDGRGRHTTTHRQLLPLPGGGVLIDTPGMRELALSADDDALAATFSDIDGLAAACRFRDCTHAGEPGCAVLLAVRDGALEADRLESWRKQGRELRWLETRDDPRAVAAEKARWKSLHKAARKWMKEKYDR